MGFWKMADPLMLRQGEEVLRRLTEQGHQAYFVGGCVRDELMHRQINDMDIATSAKPEEVMLLFERTIPTGLQHGTVTVLMENCPFEVTTFREEAHYEDHRHPSSVDFVEDLLEDLRRRDFTMNAIAADADGNLTDPFGGRSDIAAGIIRCVGQANERFDEDALRMMRAIRFASVFAFKPVKSLWSALRSSRSKMAFIAIERIRVELEKIIMGPNPLRGLALLERSGLLEYIKAPVPKTAAILDGKRDDDHWIRLSTIEHIPADRPEIRWSLLMQSLGITGELTVDLMKAWTFPNAVATKTSNIMKFDEHWKEAKALGLEPSTLRHSWISIELKFGKETAERWLQRQKLILQVQYDRQAAEPLRLLEQAEAQWHREVAIHTVSELAINGGDVIQYTGKKGGPWLGEWMDLLLHRVAAGELENDSQALLEQVKVVMNQNGES